MNLSLRVAALAALCTAVSVAAQPQSQVPPQTPPQAAPNSFTASPEIYKVIAENDKYRVIEVTWKPGQSDVAHSHPDAAVYYLTDCTLKGSSPLPVPALNATGQRKAGMAAVQPPIPVHTVQNVGTADCKLVMFEPK